eukprot:CAMPEP_0172899462 /NCGR_PEP_ID=MMETSP1075-20121228/161874_1 /TAXON_ID=2916 /ORGANISM="Ceratium fusus, Strain PA161109" /LENGTH=35 /DNA_ID= /DNA_START= /DNA_END= /DNA_ORIENTATION=
MHTTLHAKSMDSARVLSPSAMENAPWTAPVWCTTV